MIAEVNRSQVQKLMASGALLVEVLPAEEYASGHLPGAINIPMRDLTTERMRGYNPAMPIAVYCYDYT